IVTGAHLSPDYGLTVKDIEADGFPIAARVDMQLKSDEPAAIARSMGVGLSGMATVLERLKPDIAVILGDRYDMLMAATAAAMLSIPDAHSDVVEGAVVATDEALRYAIPKLSYGHLATADPHARRLVELGGAPARVMTVGAPGIDNPVRLTLLPRSEI